MRAVGREIRHVVRIGPGGHRNCPTPCGLLQPDVLWITAYTRNISKQFSVPRKRWPPTKGNDKLAFSIMLNNYNDTGKDWAAGDFNYDGKVNITDLLAMLNNYNDTGGAATFSSTLAVPEPTTMSLLGLGGAGLLARRRKNSAAK